MSLEATRYDIDVKRWSDAANLYDGGNATILTSLYRSKLCSVLDANDLKKLRYTEWCTKCFSNKTYLQQSFKPSKKPNRFMRVLAEKVAKKEPLTSFQQKFASKRLPAYTGLQYVAQCKVCGHTQQSSIPKPPKAKRPKIDPNVIVIDDDVPQQTKAKKKKKKRDRTAGLIMPTTPSAAVSTVPAPTTPAQRNSASIAQQQPTPRAVPCNRPLAVAAPHAGKRKCQGNFAASASPQNHPTPPKRRKGQLENTLNRMQALAKMGAKPKKPGSQLQEFLKML